MRAVIRALSWLDIASAAAIAWTRTALVYAYGAQTARLFLWAAAGGALCAVITLARTRRRYSPYGDSPASDQAEGTR